MPDEEKLTERLLLLVTPTEKLALEELRHRRARDTGKRASVGEWVRELMNANPEFQKALKAVRKQ